MKLTTQIAKLKLRGTKSESFLFVFIPKPPHAPADSIPLAKPDSRVRSRSDLANEATILLEGKRDGKIDEDDVICMTYQ